MAVKCQEDHLEGKSVVFPGHAQFALTDDWPFTLACFGGARCSLHFPF